MQKILHSNEITKFSNSNATTKTDKIDIWKQ